MVPEDPWESIYRKCDTRGTKMDQMNVEAKPHVCRKTYKREFFGGLTVFNMILFVAAVGLKMGGFDEPAMMTDAAARFLFTPLLGAAVIAFGLDWHSAQSRWAS